MLDFNPRSYHRLRLPDATATCPPISYRAHWYQPAPLPVGGWAGARKRTLDLVVASGALILLALPMLLLALAIRLDSPGPALFRQTRTGLDGRSFRLLKFRTMHHAACEPDECRQATRDDPRITRLGRWLRRMSLDELPQLINVLLGEMAIVGPRPHAAGSRAGARLFEDVTQRYADRHLVRPGMTGLAQIRGLRGETDTEEKLIRRVEADLEYIETWSLRLDIVIIWRTILALPRMPNAH
jgi:lipopolysaccharide/colanic/teichoic acid biosynthesis glycosyltransferase